MTECGLGLEGNVLLVTFPTFWLGFIRWYMPIVVESGPGPLNEKKILTFVQKNFTFAWKKN